MTSNTLLCFATYTSTGRFAVKKDGVNMSDASRSSAQVAEGIYFSLEPPWFQPQSFFSFPRGSDKEELASNRILSQLIV
jgi:hypothetical protein